MAELTVDGFDELEKMLSDDIKSVEDKVTKMLESGAEILKKAEKQEASKLVKTGRATGDLAKSITETKVKKESQGYSIEIYPKGKDRNGVSNATKGAVLEYGRSNMPPYPWHSTAINKSKSDIYNAMSKEWEK